MRKKYNRFCFQLKLPRNEEVSSEVEWREFSLKLTRNEEVLGEEEVEVLKGILGKLKKPKIERIPLEKFKLRCMIGFGFQSRSFEGVKIKREISLL